MLDQNKQNYKNNDSNNQSFDDAEIESERQMVEANIEEFGGEPEKLAKKLRNKEILEERVRALARKQWLIDNPIPQPVPEPIPEPISLEEEIQKLLEEYELESISDVDKAIEDEEKIIRRSANKPKALSQAENNIKNYKIILQKHAQLAQPKIKIILDDLEISNIDEAIEEQNRQIERLKILPITSIKQIKICQDTINQIDELLKLSGRSRQIKLDHPPDPFVDPVLQPNQQPNAQSLPQPYPEPANPMIQIEPESLFQREKEDAENQAEFIKSAPDSFEKSVKIIIHILYQILDKNLKAHDQFLKVPTSTYNTLIETHLINIKQTFIGEVIKNKLITDKVSQLEEPNGSLQQYQRILDSLKEIQPLISKFSFQEFFSYIEQAKKASERVNNIDIVLLLGTTGAGKSTTIHYICGSEMYETSKDGLKHIAFGNVQNIDLLNVKVSPYSRSETRYIRPIKIQGGLMNEGITLVDTPGLFDLKNAEVDVSNQIGIIMALSSVQSVKPFIVFSYKKLGGKGESFKEILTFYSQMIKDSDDLQYFNFFFSHVDKDIKIENLTAKILDIKNQLNQKEKLNERLVQFLQVIIDKAKKNKIYIIDPLDRIKFPQILDEISRSKEKIFQPSQVFQKIICQESKNKIIDQFDLHSKEIFSQFKKANAEKVGYLLSELKNFSEIMDSDQEYKIRINEILKKLILRLNQKHAEVSHAFKKQLLPGNKIGDQEVGLYQSNLMFMATLESVRKNYLCNIDGIDIESCSSQDLELEVEQLINDANQQINNPEHSKLDSQDLHDYLQKLEFLAASEIEMFVRLRNKIFKDIENTLIKIPKDTAKLLDDVMDNFEKDSVIYSNIRIEAQSVQQVSSEQQNDFEEVKNFEVEEQKLPSQLTDEFSVIMGMLERAELISKDELKKLVKKSKEQIFNYLQKKFTSMYSSPHFQDFQNLSIQTLNNLTNLSEQELNQLVDFKIEKRVSSIKKYFQLLDCFQKSMNQFDLSQQLINYIEGKQSKINEQMICWFSVQEEKLKRKVSQDKKYTAIQSIYDELMLAQQLPTMQGQSARYNRIKMHLTKLVQDKIEEAKKHMATIEKIVNSKQQEDGKSKDNSQITMYTLVSLKDAIKTIDELKWTIQNGNEEFYDDHCKDLKVSLCQLVLMIEESVRIQRDKKTNINYIGETEQAFKQIDQIQNIAGYIKIKLPDINIEDFIPEIEQNLTGAENLLMKKGIIQAREEQKIDHQNIDELLKKSECENFSKYYTYLSALEKRNFMIQKIDQLSGSKISYTDRIKDINKYFKDFFSSQWEKIKKEIKSQIENKMKKYLGKIGNIKVDKEGFYVNEDKASKYLSKYLINPIDRILGIFKMIKELKTKYEQIWKKISPHDEEDELQRPLLKFYNDVKTNIAMAHSNQVQVTNNLKIINQLIPLDQYIHEQNESKTNLIQAQYDTHFNTLIHFSSTVIKTVQEFITSQNYVEIKETLVTLQKLDGLDQKMNFKKVQNLLHQRCKQLCYSINKDSRILVRGRQLDPLTMEKINKESTELQEILKSIGDRFLDTEIYKKAQDLIHSITDQMKLDFQQLDDLINNFILTQKYKEAYDYIKNFYDSAKNLDFSQKDFPQTGEERQDEQDYLPQIQILKKLLDDSIKNKVQVFNDLKIKSESTQINDDTFLELMIQNSPKDIIENLQSTKTEIQDDDTFRNAANNIIVYVEQVFQPRISNLKDLIGEKSDSLQKKFKKYLDFCKKIPTKQAENFEKEIKKIQKTFDTDQTNESNDIFKIIEQQKKEKKNNIKTVYDRISRAKYILNNKCKEELNKFYYQEIEKTLNQFKDQGLNSVIQDKFLQFYQFQSSDSIKNYLDLQANQQYQIFLQTLQKILNSIIKRIHAIFLNEKNQEEFKIQIDDKECCFSIKQLTWYDELFKKQKSLANEMLPNNEKSLLNLIETCIKEITKCSNEFSSQIESNDPSALTEVIKIIVYMRNILTAQDSLTNISFIFDSNFIKIQEELKILYEISSKKKFGPIFAKKYKEIADQVLNAKFHNDPVTRGLELPRIEYYNNIERCYSFVLLSQQVHDDLLEQKLKIDTKKYQQDCEQNICQKYKDIESQALNLINKLEKKDTNTNFFKDFNILLENLYLIQEKFKIHESKFEQLKQRAARFIQEQTYNIKKELENTKIPNQEKLIGHLIMAQNIVQNVVQLKDCAQESIQDLLDCLQKNSQDQNQISEIAFLLKKNPIGAYIVEQQPIFICESRTFWASKIDHQDIGYVLENLLKNDGTKLSKNEKEVLKKQYDCFLNEYQNLVETWIVPFESIPKNKEQIKANIMELTQKSKQNKIDKNQKNEIYKILANLFALWTLSDFYKNKLKLADMSNPFAIKYLLKPHPAQVISIFRILGIGYDVIVQQDQTKLDPLKINQLKDYQTNNDIFFDNLVQIKTGEGKSITLAITISLFALWDFQVNCACYSQYLSNRDYNQFSDLFTFLDIQDKIFYGTFNEICERYINKDGDIRNLVLNTILKDSQIQIKALPQAKKRVILIDEVDVFFSKDFYNKVYVPIAQIKNIQISNLLDFMWGKRTDKSFTLKKLRDTQQYKECAAIFKDKYIGILEEACKDMYWAASNFQTHNYVVQNNKIGYQEMDQISFTKSYGYNTIFAHYYHSEVPAKNGQKVSPDNLNESKAIEIYCGQFSYAEIPLYSMLILGVTGTLDSLTQTENKIIKNVFQIQNFTFSPSVYGNNKLRWEVLDPYDRLQISDEEFYYQTLTDQIKNKMKGDNGPRAILVFFKNLKLLKEYQQQKIYKSLSFNKQELSELCEEKEKENIIIQATYQNTLTLTTRSFGRGTDFICRDENVERNGGVHVILTFVPDLHSEFVQIQGRTARQGNDGSFQMILKEEDLKELDVEAKSEEFNDQNKKKLEYIFKKRDLKSLQSQKSDTDAVNQIKSIHQQSLEIKDILVKQNANGSSQLCDYLIKINAGPSIKEDEFPVKTLILMDATGSMNKLLVEAKNSVNLMYERSGKILENHNLGSHLNWIQYACYRNYSSKDQILQHSEWAQKPQKLKSFMDSIGVSGGMGNEAIEIGLQHAVSVAQNRDSIPLRQIYLIGDMPPNTKQEVTSRRREFKFDKNPNFQAPAYWETELEKLRQMNIKVNTFYVDPKAKESFKEIASRTGGTSQYLDVTQPNSQDVLLRSFIPTILHMIGELNPNGDKDLGKKMAAEYMNCYK